MNELRVFANKQDMMDDIKAFCEDERHADSFNKQWGTAKVGEWTIRWYLGENVYDLGGLEFQRVQVDCFVEPENQRYIMSRIRGYGWEPMIAFYKHAHNFNY